MKTINKSRRFSGLLIFTAFALFMMACEDPAGDQRTYKVTFNTDGGSAAPNAQSVASGAKATQPNDPYKVNLVFGGWVRVANEASAVNLNAVTYDFTAPVTSDIILKAKWDPATLGVDQRNVTFVLEDGRLFSTEMVTNNTPVAEPTPAPTKTGNQFDGWYEVADAGDAILSATPKHVFTTPVAGNVIFKAKWVATVAPVVQHRVTFDSDGGLPATIPIQNINTGHTATDPGTPTKPGRNGVNRTFDGWYLVTGGSIAAGTPRYDFATATVTSDITLKAKWIAQYTVTFDADGGLTAATIPIQTIDDGNTALDLGGTPTKANNQFDGWYLVLPNGSLDASAYVFATPVTGDITLKAKWVATVAPVVQHRVTFDSDGGLPATIPIQNINTGHTATDPGTPTKTGRNGVNRTFDGWYLVTGGSIAAGTPRYDFATATVTSDITLKAKWVVQYTVTFDTDGGSSATPAVQTLDTGHTATDPGTPTKTGNRFDGWYLVTGGILAPSAYAFATTVTNDITLKAVWVVQHRVTFDTDGGSSATPAVQTLDTGHTATDPGTPTKTGRNGVNRTFDGWYLVTGGILAPSAYAFATTVTADITLKAKWVAQYTVTFDTDGGSSLTPAVQTLDTGQMATRPSLPTKRGRNGVNRTFDGWRLVLANGGLDTSAYAFAFTPVTADITIKAKWIDQYTVTFDTDFGSSLTPAVQTLNNGNVATAPGTPTKTGRNGVNRTFDGWHLVLPNGSLDASPYVFATPVISDITLKAKWVDQHIVAFDTDGGLTAATIPIQTIDDGTTAIDLGGTPTKPNNQFDGWYLVLPDGSLDASAYVFATPVTGDIILKAKWVATVAPVVQHTVTFDSDGGSPAIIPIQNINTGHTATDPGSPHKAGNRFDGWYLVTGGSIAAGTPRYDFATATVTSNISLKAVWVVQYTVTFDTDGGSSATPAVQTLAAGHTATDPGPPTKTGVNGAALRFDGWHLVLANGSLDASAYAFATTVTADITIKAKWGIIQHTVTFDPDGGRLFTAATETVNSGDRATEPFTPNKAGSGFVGWYLVTGGSIAAGTPRYDFNTDTVTSDITLKAKWVVQRRVTTVIDTGGTQLITAFHTVNDNDPFPRPIDPVRTTLPNIFDGWYLVTGGSTASSAYDFTAPVTSDITLEAKWR